MSVQSPLGAFFSDLRKKRIIEILAAFIGGGWLLLEFVHFILIGHYHLPEKLLDVTLITLIGILAVTLIWRWFSGWEKPRNFKLERVLIPLVIVVTGFLDFNLLVHLRSPKSETIPVAKWKNSVAVLPFVDMSPQKDQEYFCDSMTEELINRLSNIRGLKVPARTSVFYFKGKPQALQEVGQKLKVEKMLEGSVRKAGNELRITAQLINIADGYLLWSETFNKELKDVFSIQDEISLRIIDKLKVELLGDEKARVVKRYTDDNEAYDSYIRGMWLLNNKLTGDDWRKALQHFERAIDKDPNFSLAYVEIANVYLNLSFWHFVPADESLPRAKKALQQAQRIDQELPEALTLSGVIKYRFDYDWSGGEAEIRKALALNPNHGLAHEHLATILLLKGQLDEATEEFSGALELDPLSLMAEGEFAWFLYNSGRYDDAIRQCRKSLDLDLEFPAILEVFALSQVQKSLFPEAIEALTKAVASSGNSTECLCYLAYAYVMSGDLGKAQGILTQLDKLSESVYVSKHYLASIQGALGNKDKAFDFLDAAYRERDADLMFLKTDPKFAPLRSDPRYALMLKKIGLGK